MGLKRRSRASAEFSMSSLTDIIFLLLIFFMLTSTLVSQNALNLKLPSSSSKTVAPASIAISIDQQGNYYYNKDRATLQQIRARISSQIAGQADPSKTTVTILSDKSTPVEYVVQVMSIANDLDVSAILATEPPK